MSSIIMKRKIDLFNKLYKEIAGHGINGDTELAHVNKYEAAVLKAMGGSGTVNNVTGLRQYDFFGGDDPAPAPAAPTTTTVKQVSDLPEYFKPYVEELFATAQDVYDRPYVAYEGDRLAPVSAEQKTAFQGLRDMFTTVDPETGVRSFRDPTSEGFEEAVRLSGRGARGFDELAEGEFEETYMSPYKQAVTDIQVKAAQEKQEAERKQRQGAARMANALGQGRYGVQEGMAEYYDQRLLDEIQKKGLQESYETGLKVFDADRLAARSGATQRAALAGDELSSGLKSLGALQTAGEAQRAIAQQPLDINYEEFARQQQFPKQNLQELSGILRGFNVQPSTYKTSQVYKQPPSLGSQLLAAGSLGAGISKGLGSSLLGKAAGGGLMSVAPERYQTGNIVEERRKNIERMEAEEKREEYEKDLNRRRAFDNWRKARQNIRDALPEHLRPTGPGYGEGQDIIDLTGTTAGALDTPVLDISSMVDTFEEINKGDVKEFDPPQQDEVGADIGEMMPPEETVTEVSETTDETIFDFGAALPWFKMAADLSKSGQDTAEAASTALSEFEKTTSSRRKDAATINLANAQAEYNKARPLIEAAKANRKLSKEQRDRAITIVSTMLESVTKVAAGAVGGQQQYQPVIDNLMNELRALMRADYGALAGGNERYTLPPKP